MTQPEVTTETVQALIESARKLGLTWDLRFGMINAVPDLFAVAVQLDGDANEIYATSAIGQVFADQRVVVVSVPPAGQYIVGTLTQPVAQQPCGKTLPTGSGTTTSASYADVPGSPSDTLIKRYSATRIWMHMHFTCFSTAISTFVEIGVQFSDASGTADGAIANLVINPANTHLQVSGTAIFPWSGKGNVTVKPRWRRSAGGGTLTTDGNDRISFAAVEVI